MKKEHILVCLSSSPSNPKVIQTASKMAKVFDADFTALFIETTQSKNMTQDNKKRLEDNTLIAKQNNAKVVTVNGDDIAFQVSEYAKTSKVTKIVIGRSGYKPNSFFTPPNFVDKLIKHTPEIEIYVIPDKIQKMYFGQEENKKVKTRTISFSYKDFILSVLMLFIATITGGIFYKFVVNVVNIILIYILAVLYISYVTESKLHSLISSLFAVLLFDFFFTAPYFSLKVNTSDYPFTFIILFMVAFFASTIMKSAKEQSRQSSLKAYSTEVMLEMSQKLQQIQNIEEIKNVTVEQIGKLLESKVIFYSPENAENTAQFVFSSNKPAGAGTEYFSKSEFLYLPVSNINKVFGVVSVSNNNLNEFKKNLLIAMLRESALAYEKESAMQAKNELILKNKQEELRSTLLRAISHDLRTPLTGISGFADILINNSNILSEEKKRNIYSDIYDDSVWLLNLVENLLAITRFDKNEISIRKEPEYISDVISDALRHLGRKKEKFYVHTNIEGETLSARMDGRLISQVIFNLADNAMKYSPEYTNITVSAKAEGDSIEVSVADEGCGIKDEDKKQIFEMFYTINNSITDGRRGLGLGLALCKAVVSAHGGDFTIKDNVPSGTIFSFKIKTDLNNNGVSYE